MSVDAAPEMSFEDAMSIGRLDAHDQSALVRKRELSAEELVETAIIRAHFLDDSLNALSFPAFDRARKRARAALPDTPVAGVPYLLKDSLDYPGMPSRGGSRLVSNAPVSHRPLFAAGLDDCGMIPIGKSSMPEFGLLPTTEPLLYGAVANPYASDRSPGGSSGGAAAAVSAGIVPVAHASDGGGSIRIPASCCGLFGFKPSRAGNLRARRPSVIEDLLCGDSMLSRSVRDGAWFARRLRPAGFRPLPSYERARPLRIGIMRTNLLGNDPDPDVTEVIARTGRLCEGLGHDVGDLAMPLDGKQVLDAFRTIWGFLARDVVDRCALWAASGDIQDGLEPWTLGLAEWSDRLTPLDLEQAVALIGTIENPLQRIFEDCDLILSPVLTDPPVPLGRLGPDRAFDDLMREMFDYIAYTPLQNVAGLPSMSVPLYTTRTNLPVGSMFTGRRNADDVLLDFAAELELAAPWTHRWPPSSLP